MTVKRILVNHTKEDLPYLPILQYHLKNRRIQALATVQDMTITELLTKAKNANCDGILLCNHATLQNLVPGKEPTLDQFRGSVLRLSVPVVVCNPLAHTHSIDHGAFLLENDLDKFKTLDVKAPPFEFKVLETMQLFEEAYKLCSECILLAYDIETKTFLQDEETLDAGETLITCCSWSGFHPKKGIINFVLPLIDFGVIHFSTEFMHMAAIDLLRRINKLPIPKVMHNGQYDVFHSIRYHAEPLNWTLDTMALAWCQYSSLPKTLDFVASISLPFYIQWKQEAEEASKAKDLQRYWAYNARDTYYTLLICIAQLHNLPAYARANYAEQFKLVYPFTYMAFEGLAINEDKRKELREKHQKSLDQSLSALRKMLADPDFNPGSPKQVKTYIYDIIGAVDPRIGKDSKTKQRKVRSTDEKNLKAIGEQHPILLRISDAILSYREAQKAIGTYFDYLQYRGRLLYSIGPFGTDTARASSSASAMWCGTQIQNIPAYAKECLEADEGYVLEEFDNSQSEARCTAYLSEETALIERLEDKTRDFYKSLGTLFFGIPYELVTKEFRNACLKKIVHGTNYMMGDDTFIENAGAKKLVETSSFLGIKIILGGKPDGRDSKQMTLKAYANYLLEVYHIPFAKVRQWYGKVKNTISTTKMLVSPLGWTRYFFGDINKKHQILRSAVAHGPQNLSVAILNRGVWKVWTLCKQEKGALRLKAQIHDSLFTQRRKERTDLTQTVRGMLTTPTQVLGRTMVIPVDYKDGTNWGNMEEHK